MVVIQSWRRPAGRVFRTEQNLGSIAQEKGRFKRGLGAIAVAGSLSRMIGRFSHGCPFADAL
jgi:hypothetical protein